MINLEILFFSLQFDALNKLDLKLLKLGTVLEVV